MRKFIAVFFAILLFHGTSSAATYYIDSSWGGTESGTVAEPYRSRAGLPSLRTSDKIYFKAGTTYSNWQTWAVTTGGTKKDHLVIGTYYVKAGNANYDLAGILSKGGRATLDGGWSGTNLAGCTCTTCYEAAIQLNAAYSDIKNLNIVNWKGQGIRIKANVDYCSVTGNTMGTLMRGGISAASGADHATIKNNKINNTAHISVGDDDIGGQLGCDWPATINIMGAYASVQGNSVTTAYGEGIGVYTTSAVADKQAHHAIVEYNFVQETYSAGIYVSNSAYNTIRYNIVLGSTNPEFLGRGEPGFGPDGMADGNEHFAGAANISHDNEFYGNLVAFTSSCWTVGGNDSKGNVDNDLVWNNTCIDNYHQISGWSSGSRDNHTNIDVRNNIFFCSPGSTCGDAFYNTKTEWFSQLGHNGYANDPGYGSNNTINSTIPVAKSSGWQALTTASPITYADFLPASREI